MPDGKPLSDKHERFVAEYLVDSNATEAAKRAGYSPRGAEVTGHRMLRNPKIAAELERRRQRQLERLDVQATDILREMVRIAGSDVRKLFDEAGNLKRIKDLPDEIAAAIASVEVVKRNLTSGDGQMDTVVKVRLWDKVKALELLARHKGLFPREPAEQTINILLLPDADLLERARQLLEKAALQAAS